ncbi:MAG: LysR family transcriptional regulator, partial [Collinsella sp.]|nr:LysR family transcriptional regulator [Collinsella sp.]
MRLPGLCIRLPPAPRRGRCRRLCARWTRRVLASRTSREKVMKLQQLRYVVKVAECGSITEASRRLFVSQPSITASIRDLENEMGVHIFERTNKGVIVS